MEDLTSLLETAASNTSNTLTQLANNTVSAISAINSATSTLNSDLQSLGQSISNANGLASTLRQMINNIDFSNPHAISMDTGGYTGSWGKDGRFAMLHEKELVLNQSDTANLLSAVDLVRTIATQVDLQAQAAMSFGLQAAAVKDTSTNLQQEITIHAEFPNAINRSEIEAAFESLATRSTQYVNRKF